MVQAQLLTDISERFTLEEAIGHGTFGDVYRAIALDRKVWALKEIDPRRFGKNQDVGKDLVQSWRERNIWEVINGSPLFPEFEGVYFVGNNGGPRMLYLAMELIEGQTLAEALRQRKLEAKGGYPEEEARRIILETAKSIKVLHDSGYLHRDIASNNIMITPNGAIKNIDLGAVKEKPVGGPLELKTPSSTRLLTAGYAAPEVRVGMYSEQSDMYALGALWAELASGKSADLLSKEIPFNIKYHLSSSKDDALLQRLVAADPKDRPRSIDEVIAELSGSIEVVSSLVNKITSNLAKEEPPIMNQLVREADASEVISNRNLVKTRTRFSVRSNPFCRPSIFKRIFNFHRSENYLPYSNFYDSDESRMVKYDRLFGLNPALCSKTVMEDKRIRKELGERLFMALRYEVLTSHYERKDITPEIEDRLIAKDKKLAYAYASRVALNGNISRLERLTNKYSLGCRNLDYSELKSLLENTLKELSVKDLMFTAYCFQNYSFDSNRVFVLLADYYKKFPCGGSLCSHYTHCAHGTERLAYDNHKRKNIYFERIPIEEGYDL